MDIDVSSSHLNSKYIVWGYEQMSMVTFKRKAHELVSTKCGLLNGDKR
jgi:hypothetical protein